MKIMFVTHEFGINKTHGGVASYLDSLLFLLLENFENLEISVLLITDKQNIDQEYNENFLTVFYGRTYFYFIDAHTINDPYAYLKLNETIEEDKPNIIEVPDFLGFLHEIILQSYITGVHSDILFINLLHTSLFDIFSWKNQLSNIDSCLKILIQRELFQAFLSDYNVSPSYFLGQFVSTTHNIRNAVQIIPSPFFIKEQSYYHLDNLDRDTTKILYFGRIEDRKSVDYLISSCIDILKDNQDVELYIVGNTYIDNGIDTREKIYNLIPTFLHDQVHFFDFSKNKQQFFDACDIFVIPSQFENFSYALLEAISYGIPVIGSISSGFIDISGPKWAFDFNIFGSLQSQIKKLLSMKREERVAVAEEQYHHMKSSTDIKFSVIKRYELYKNYYNDKVNAPKIKTSLIFSEFYRTVDSTFKRVKIPNEGTDSATCLVFYPNKDYPSILKELLELIPETIYCSEEIYEEVLFVALPKDLWFNISNVEDIAEYNNLPLIILNKTSEKEIISEKEYNILLYKRKFLQKWILPDHYFKTPRNIR